MVNNPDDKEMSLVISCEDPSLSVEELPPTGTELAVPSFAKAWMYNSNQENKLVSANELTSLSALISYVAHHSGEKEFGVERRLSDRFNVPNVTCLPAAQYDSAIRYLVDTMMAI